MKVLIKYFFQSLSLLILGILSTFFFYFYIFFVCEVFKNKDMIQSIKPSGIFYNIYILPKNGNILVNKNNQEIKKYCLLKPQKVYIVSSLVK
jgi:predicted permease